MIIRNIHIIYSVESEIARAIQVNPSGKASRTQSCEYIIPQTIKKSENSGGEA